MPRAAAARLVGLAEPGLPCPAPEIAVPLSLGLGIGGNSAIFTLVNAVLLRDLPVAEPQELFVLKKSVRGQEFTPDGLATDSTFFIGANGEGQSAPSYIKAADCGWPTIIDLAAAGFPDMHIVMLVTGNNQAPVELQSISVS